MSVPDDRSLTSHLRDWWLAPLINRIQLMEDNLMAREDEVAAQLGLTIADVKTAYLSKDVEIAKLREELRNADAAAEARVDEALAADSEHDADKMAAFDAALREIVPGQPVEIPADNGEGGGDVVPEPGVQG